MNIKPTASHINIRWWDVIRMRYNRMPWWARLLLERKYGSHEQAIGATIRRIRSRYQTK